MTRARNRLLLILLSGIVMGIGGLYAQSTLIDEGIGQFQQSQFNQAVLIFREALLEPESPETEAQAYFWLAKSFMAVHRLTEAERNLEYFLRTFPDHEYSVEAQYQRGRILMEKENYEAAIQTFSQFVTDFPDSPFVANAIYWSGEALYALGRMDEAKRLFETVIQDYPRSFRVEASRYRSTLIDLTGREEQLMELLQWSHEEYLQALDEFQRKEQAYQEALAGYQARLQSAATEDFRDEIVRLSTQVRTLQEQLRSKDAQIARLQEQIRQTGAAPAAGGAEPPASQ